MNKTFTAQQLINYLNELLEIDRDAISKVFLTRMPCNEKLADHPTVQVRQLDSGDHLVGPLGILNGFIGADEDSIGFISVIFDEETGTIQAFQLRLN